MALGLLDLSIVTDRLIKQVKDDIAASSLWLEEPGGEPGPPFTINVTGLAPDATRELSGCQLSIYLYHVAADAFWRNTPVPGPQARPGTSQPLALDLRYLVSAYSTSSYVEEQQAMSIALKSFHERPRVDAVVPIDGRIVEVTVTLDPEAPDERMRVWQAISKSMRLSASYRVAVVFLEPPPPPPTAPPPTTFVLASPAIGAPPAAGAFVMGSTSRVAYVGPDGSTQSYDLSPAVAAPGATLVLLGGGLGVTGVSDRVFLVAADGSELDITAWIVPASAPELSRLELRVPNPGAPTAGTYSLRVGSGAARSGSTGVRLAARVDPAPGPLLTGDPVTLTGGVFVAGATIVDVGGSKLTASAGAPGPGQFQRVDGATLVLRPPASLPPGTYPIRVSVNGVDSPPAHWLVRS